MIRAAVLNADIDLRDLLAAISQHGIRVRVNEESGSQVIWVNTPEDAEKVAMALTQWQNLKAQGLLQERAPMPASTLGASIPVVAMLKGVANAFLQAPVTVLLILAAVIVALMSDLGSDLRTVSGLFFPSFSIDTAGGLSGFAHLLMQITSVDLLLRTLTPALLHFGAIHLVFNSLWIWQFGRMIERAQSSVLYGIVVLLIAFFSNASQYWWSHTANFGGLSGVVYGLLGYIWMWQLLLPYGRLRLPPSMIAVLLIALVVMELVAGSWIASAAHAGGLLAGIVIGLLSAGFYSFRRR